MDFCLSNTDLQWAELSSYWERSCSPCLWSKVKSTVLVWMHVHPAYRSPSTQHHPGSESCYSIFGSCVLAVMGSCPCVLLPQSQVSEGTHSITPALTVCPVRQCMFPLVRDYTETVASMWDKCKQYQSLCYIPHESPCHAVSWPRQLHRLWIVQTKHGNQYRWIDCEQWRSRIN